MIVSRTPLRVSFVGGGSDFPEYFRRQPGAVASIAIDKYLFVTVNRRFDDHIRVSYTRTENVACLDDLQHDLIREALRLCGCERGIEVTTIGDLPAGAGLGSSSSLAVGLLNACIALQGRRASAAELAELACCLEIERLGRPIGRQDQYAAAFGGFNVIGFKPDASVDVRAIRCGQAARDHLLEGLLLFYTGTPKESRVTLVEVAHNIQHHAETRAALTDLVALVPVFEDCLSRHDLSEIGSILDRAWNLKKSMGSQVSTPTVDRCYERALEVGAEGGKLLGAGGGGCLLLYAASEAARLRVREAMTHEGLQEIRFRGAPSGSAIVYDGRNEASS